MSQDQEIPKYYHKRMLACNAAMEVNMVLKADKIDPEQVYHIGNPVISPDDLVLVKNYDAVQHVTVQYPYGGMALTHYPKEKLNTSFFRDLIPVLKGLSEMIKQQLYHVYTNIPNML